MITVNMTKQEAFNLLTNHGTDDQAVEFMQWQAYFASVRHSAQNDEEHY